MIESAAKPTDGVAAVEEAADLLVEVVEAPDRAGRVEALLDDRRRDQRDHAAVDDEDLAGDVLGGRRGEVGDQRGDVVGASRGRPPAPEVSSPKTCAVIAVRARGQIALARTPTLPSPRAVESVSAVMPALAAA